MSEWTPQDWTMFFTALGVFLSAVFSAWAALQANLAKIKSEANGEVLQAQNTEISKVQDNVTKIEVSTNSMQSKLVEATERASMGEGELKGRAAERLESKIETLAAAVKQNGNHGKEANLPDNVVAVVKDIRAK